MDWSVVARKEIPPPWVPEVSGGTDFSYFDNYPDSGSPIQIPTDAEEKLFEDF